MKISVCMIVKNEEDQLAKSLSSIPSTYEIIVVDTGSTDRTIDIANRFNVELYQYVWNGNFADARNEAMRKATGDYILILDADEELTSTIEDTVNDFIRVYPNQAGAVKIENIMDDEISITRMIRFFPNYREYQFVGKVHERLCWNGQEIDMIKCPIIIRHFGYQHELYQKKEKYERYVHLYKKMLWDNPKDGYMLYQLGKLYFSNKEYSCAYNAFEKSLTLQQFDRLYFPPMLVQLGYTLKELGQSKVAVELLEQFLPMYPKFPDIPLVLGLLSIECGNFVNIEKYFKLALEIGETDHYSTIAGNGSFRAAHNLAVFYEVAGHLELAKATYEIAVQYGFQPSIARLKVVSQNTKQI